MAREGVAKVWRVQVQTDVDGNESVDLVNVYSFTPFAGVAATAVDVCRSGPLSHVSSIHSLDTTASSLQSAWLVALGAETGDLQVWRVGSREVESGIEYESHLLHTVSDAHSHGATVRRLRWRPQTAVVTGEVSAVSWELASCGEDRTVRVHRVSQANP